MLTVGRPRTPLTLDGQAKQLGYSRSTLLRHRRAGLPAPRDGERPSAWRRRAARWVAAHVPKPGRRLSGDAAEALCNLRRLRAQRAELRLARAVEQVHSVAACAAWLDGLVADLERGMASVPAAVADSWPVATADRYDIGSHARDVIHSAHSALLDAMHVGAPLPPDAAAALAVEPPDQVSLRDRGDFWLAVWRGTRVETERRALARERGDVHDAAQCNASLCARAATYVQTLYRLPNYWGSALRHLPPADVRERVAADLAKAREILRGHDGPQLVSPADAPASDANDDDNPDDDTTSPH